jgi:hypothetical protein
MDNQQQQANEQNNEQKPIETSNEHPQSNEAVKVEKIMKDPILPITSAATSSHESSVHEATPTTTVIATRQRMITTQGHIREIEVPEHYEQFQITASGDDQNVYTYEQTSGGIITINQPENLLKRSDILIEKEPVINVVTAEPQTVYVELKNNVNDDQPRYISNAKICYESPGTYHRYTYHAPPHNSHMQREVLKTDNAPQELQIYEAEHQSQSNEPSNSISSEHQQHHGSGEPKAHYTNLETVGSSQSSYYIASDGYQPANSNGFTYLPTSSAKDGGYIYHHPSSPVLYKGELANITQVSTHATDHFAFVSAKHQPPHYTQVYDNNSMQTSPPQVYYKSDPGQYGWPSAIDYNAVS